MCQGGENNNTELSVRIGKQWYVKDATTRLGKKRLYPTIRDLNGMSNSINRPFLAFFCCPRPWNSGGDCDAVYDLPPYTRGRTIAVCPFSIVLFNLGDHFLCLGPAISGRLCESL